MACLLVAGFLFSVLFSIADGSGQSCVDLDPQGCSDMAKQNPNMCMDHDLATAVCPQYCHRCPIICYNCNSPSRDVRGCNTITCNSGETCDARQSADTKCCSDDLCNTPDLIPHVTSSTPSPTSHSTSPTGSASPESYTYEYMGCFASRYVTPYFYWRNEMTSQMCSQTCARLGTKFMLTEASIYCFCLNEIKPSDKMPDTECNSGCGGNWTYEMCGGGTWKGSAYRMLPNTYEYMGCYVDKSCRILSDVIEWSNALTTKMCFQICAQHGKKFMLTEAPLCFCGDELTPTEKVQDSECNRPCGGNRTEMCGSQWRSSVYKILPRNVTTVI